MGEPQVIHCLSDHVFYELLDKERLRLRQATIIDIQDEVKCGLVMLHMRDDMLRRHLIMHVTRLDTFFEVREEVQDIARSREAAGSVAPMKRGCSDTQLRQGQR